MDAQLAWARRWPVRTVSALVVASLLPLAAQAAGYRTTNFTVAAPTPQLAKEIGDTAEHCRKALAIEWLGRELPNWTKPCPISAHVAPHLGAGGATSFIFDQGQVFGWDMKIQGSRERVLDSVVPHEVTHTIFATHFRQPLPRWADEGACTTVEHHSEIAKQEGMLISFLKTRRGIPFNDMFAMTEYPSDVLPLYAQGHSLARYMIAQRGKRTFMTFLADGMRDGNWPRAVREHYEYEHLLALQNSWMDWIKAGRPAIQPVGAVLLASAEAPTPPDAPEARGEVGAGMGELTRQIEPLRAEAGGAKPQADKSVYGENAAWRPAKRRPIVPASASVGPRETAWR